MKQDDIFPEFATSLEDILREGARKLLQQAIENEVYSGGFSLRRFLKTA